MDAKIFRTVCAFANEDGLSYQLDTIEHRGSFWLVPEWQEASVEGYRIPAIIIRLDDLAHQRFQSGSPQGDFILSAPIPRAALFPTRDKPAPIGLVVIHQPDIRFPIPGGQF